MSARNGGKVFLSSRKPVRTSLLSSHWSHEADIRLPLCTRKHKTKETRVRESKIGERKANEKTNSNEVRKSKESRCDDTRENDREREISVCAKRVLVALRVPLIWRVLLWLSRTIKLNPPTFLRPHLPHLPLPPHRPLPLDHYSQTTLLPS